jgi:glycosyltransferase involved in cell wall biosynthesis
MRIAVNALTIGTGCGGEDTFVHNVLATMREVQPEVEFIPITGEHNSSLFESFDQICVDDIHPDDDPSHIAKAFLRAAKQADANHLFSSVQTAPSQSALPMVLYAVDLRFLDEPPPRRRFGPVSLPTGTRLNELKKACARATAIVTASEFVRKRCLEALGVPMDHVVVAPPGVSDVFDQPQPCFVQQPFLLMVGDTYAYRNVSRLMEAFIRLQEEFPHDLIVVGQARDAEPAEWGPRVLRFDRCPDAHRASLYQHCAVCICPSLYEGCGITALEAMRSGARYVSGRVGGIPEVAGSTPIYYNPESTPAMVGAIRRALQEDPPTHTQHARLGKQSAAEFTWEKCAWKTLHAFRRE